MDKGQRIQKRGEGKEIEMKPRRKRPFHYSASLSEIFICLIFFFFFSSSAMCQDRYEDDGTPERANSIILDDQNPAHQDIPGYERFQSHDFHDEGDEDWVKFFVGDQNRIFSLSAISPGVNCDAVIEIYDSDGKTLIKSVDYYGIGKPEYAEFRPVHEGVYYAGIRNYDPTIYGQGSDYQLRLTETSPVGFSGFIYGRVTPEGVETVITTNGGGAVITLPNSYFYMPHIAGSFNLLAAAPGFQPFSTPVIVNELQVTELNITLKLIITTNAGPNGSIIPSDPAAVDYGGSQTFTIAPDNGYSIADIMVDGNSIVDFDSSGASYTFENVKENHTIEVIFTENTHTIYSISGPNGSIMPSGGVTVAHGGSQTFTITPEEGYAIANIKVDGSYVRASMSYTFEDIITDHTIEAIFTNDKHIISASAAENGIIEPSGSIYIAHGANQTFTIAPNPEYDIADVKVDGVSVGADTTYTFISVTDAHSIEATFTRMTYTITPGAGLGGSIEPDESVIVNHADDQTFAITPDNGYAIADVKVDDDSVGDVPTYTFENIASNHLIVASFEVANTITSIAGQGGSITPSGEVYIAMGTTKTFTITPDPGYEIADVIVDDNSMGADPTYTFENVTDNYTIVATFTKKTYAITPSAGLGGSIEPDESVIVDHADDQAFTITPDPGYYIVDVKVDDISVGAVPIHIFENVQDAHEIEASFTNYTDHIVKVSAGDNGVISPSGSVVVSDGADATFMIAPDSGYAIADVKVDGYSIGAVSGCKLRLVSADHTIEASFGKERGVNAGINVIGRNGRIVPSGPVTVVDGSDLTFTITPDSGYDIEDVKVDGSSVGAVSNYTFEIISSDNHTIEAHFSQKVHTVVASAESNGRIVPSGAVAVAHGAGRTFTIIPDSGYAVANVRKDGFNAPVEAIANDNDRCAYTVTATADHVVEAIFIKKTYAIIPIAGPNGIIISDGATTVSQGDDKVFTIAPDSGYAVKDVTVDGVSVGAVRSYTFEDVADNYKIVASFTDITRAIASHANPGGSITPSGEVIVAKGVSQTFQIKPDPGYAIANVKVDGKSEGAKDTVTYLDVTTDDHKIEASFTDDYYTITTTIAGESHYGKISPRGPVAVAHGASPKFWIEAEPGYEIEDVKVDGSSFGVTKRCIFFNVTDNHTIETTFKGFKIAVGAVSNGAILPSGGSAHVGHRGNKTFTIAPDPGYIIENVTVDGSSIGAVTSYTFESVTSDDHRINASFIPKKYTITADSGANGAVYPSGSITIDHGASQAFVIIPDEGYAIANVKLDGVSRGAVMSYVFDDVDNNHIIEASFTEGCTILARADINGTIFPSGSVTVVPGSSARFTITPDNGFEVDDVIMEDTVMTSAISLSGSPNVYDFDNVTSDGATVKVTFSAIIYTITVSSGLNGAISPSGSVPVLMGNNQTFTITPDSGYAIADVKVDGTSFGVIRTCQFFNVTDNHTIEASFRADLPLEDKVTSEQRTNTPPVREDSHAVDQTAAGPDKEDNVVIVPDGREPEDYGWAWNAVLTGDFDGDGGADIAVAGSGAVKPMVVEWRVAKTDGNGFSCDAPCLWSVDFGKPGDAFFTGDFNADGKTDLGLSREEKNLIVKWFVAASDGTKFVNHGEWMEDFGDPGDVFLAGDFNGDGKTDIAMGREEDPRVVKWIVAASDGTKFVDDGEWMEDFGDPGESFFAGDFNGDGITDMAVAEQNGSKGMRWSVAASDGTRFVNDGEWIEDFGDPGDAFLSGDFNDDGKTDIAIANEESPLVVKWRVTTSDGVEFFNDGQWIEDFGKIGDEFMAGDFNGDGMTDIAACGRSDQSAIQYISVAISDGTGFIHDGAWTE